MKTKWVVHGVRFDRSAFTLLEVIVVIVIVGVTMGVSTLAFESLRAPREADVTRALRLARSEAIQTGRPIAIDGNHAPRTTHVLFFPDGRAIGAGVDALTGAPSAH